jgi:hypothetical protein
MKKFKPCYWTTKPHGKPVRIYRSPFASPRRGETSKKFLATAQRRNVMKKFKPCHWTTKPHDKPARIYAIALLCQVHPASFLKFLLNLYSKNFYFPIYVYLKVSAVKILGGKIPPFNDSTRFFYSVSLQQLLKSLIEEYLPIIGKTSPVIENTFPQALLLQSLHRHSWWIVSTLNPVSLKPALCSLLKPWTRF